MDGVLLAGTVAPPIAPSSTLNCLPRHGSRSHAPVMFCVSEEEAAAIRTEFEQCGELSAVVELRRLFPGVINIAWARECVRTIADWQPLPVPPSAVPRSKPRQLSMGPQQE